MAGNICIGTLDRGGITVVHPTNGSAEFVPVPGDTHCTNLLYGPNDRSCRRQEGRLAAV